MSFFNANPESQDLQLVPAAFRRDEELVAVAAECEADVLGTYTVTIPGAVGYGALAVPGVGVVPTGAYALDATAGVYVCLRGFAPTREACAPLLREALTREIAAVIRWRMSQWRADPHLQSESATDGSKVKSYRDSKNDPMPPSFGGRLRPYDIRPAAVVI